MFAHLHVRSWYSFLAGASSPEALAEKAALHGQSALAITDKNGFYGAIKHQQACSRFGIKPIYGCTLQVDDHELLFLAKSNLGYSRLCDVLTKAHLRDRLNPHIEFSELQHLQDVICIDGIERSKLKYEVWNQHHFEAKRHLQKLKELFGDDLYVEFANNSEKGRLAYLEAVSELCSVLDVQALATGDVRYAEPKDYSLYDLMICIKELTSIFDEHELRPRNAEQYLKDEKQLKALIPYPRAFYSIQDIVASCNVDLNPGFVTPPKSGVTNIDPETHLRLLCEEGMKKRYSTTEINKANSLLEKELNVICDLKLEEYFLVVHEIVEEARKRGIRCSGRGSAANSIVCYVLKITHVDPLEHNLLFERFLHRGRKGTPDIDIDFDTERRDEMLQWITHRFGLERTAMTATVNTYQLKSAFRDSAKAFGWPLETINSISKLLPHSSAKNAPAYQNMILEQLGNTPLAQKLCDMIPRFNECPRHLGLHSGGMVLSRDRLQQNTPVQISANGIKVVQFDKDDVEALGLIKFDLLGLRMLACISECVEIIHRSIDESFILDEIPFDDPKTFEMIRSGKTLGCFQIESQGQMHLLAKNQPEVFNDIIAEIALFRPGPLQGGVVYPFVKRRKGKEPVEYMHPDLEPILKDTYGIILFQEQVLEVVHKFAGMSLEEADRFRQLMSKFRDPGDMQKMRVKFVAGAMKRGIDERSADQVFEKVSKFVGYGFCRSHAAAFALTVYQSAFLKCHFPHAFMAAFMQHRPGMYNQMTLEEEAKRFGVNTLLPSIHKSGTRYDIEADQKGRWCIRKPLTSIKGFNNEVASSIVMERLHGEFNAIEDFCRRVDMDHDLLDKLARSGALDEICGSSRRALWEVGVFKQKTKHQPKQLSPELLSTPIISSDEIPDFEHLEPETRLNWDYETHAAARVHPMSLVRRQLNDLEIRPVSQCYRLSKNVKHGFSNQKKPEISTAGIVILRQRPGTAKGFMFLTLEDETGFIQTIVPPAVCQCFSTVLYHSSLIVRGVLSGENGWAGLLVKEVWILDNMFGGYEGRPSYSGGKDRWITSKQENRFKAHMHIERYHELNKKVIPAEVQIRINQR